MTMLFEVLVVYVRLSLIVACCMGVLVYWRHRERRRPFLYIGLAYGGIYVLDVLRFLLLLPVMEERFYRSLRVLLAIGTLSGAMWTMFFTFLGDRRRSSGSSTRG